MKIQKHLFAAAFAVLALAHVASAQVNIYISGAPATRKIWNLALYNTLVTTSSGAAGIAEYFTGSTYSTANQIVLTGGKISGTAVTIYGSWTGSTGGNQSIAISPSQSNTSLKIGFINLASTSGTGSTVTSNTNNLEYPQFNLSDTEQATVPFHGAVTITSPHTSYVTLNEATPTNPAVTGFKFLTNKGAPASLNNITTNLAQQLFQSAGVPLAQFTGSNSDEGTTVYPVGRDISSGARYILLAETGIGTGNDGSLVQFEPSVTSGTITDIADYPSPGGTINLITFDEGNGGYPSFSTVETVLSATSTASTGWIVTYVTDSDAITAVAAGAHELAWNGVYYGSAVEGPHNTPVSIAEGQYTYWSYLHVYYNQSYISTNYPLALSFANSLDSDLSTDTGTGAILTSDLNVYRNADGDTIYPIY